MTIIPTLININTAITNEIQIGANTHNQDHVIIPVNFNVMNRIANKPKNPIPELDVDLLSDIFLNLKVCLDEETRTPDLLLPKQAIYQLIYI